MTASKAKRVSRLEDHVGYWIRLVSNHVSASFARRLEKVDVSVSEWVVLRKLYEAQAASPSSLGESIGMTKAPVSRLVERLVRKGLIERKASREDGRVQQIRLSASGQQLVPRLGVIADQNDAAFFGDLPENTRAALIAILWQTVAQSQSHTTTLN